MNEFIEHFWASLSVLKERDAEIMDLRFGLSNGNPQTLQAIADVYGLSRERIRQLEERSLRRIIGNGNRELKNNNFQAPCAALFSYIDKTIGMEESHQAERLADFVEQEMAFVSSHTQAAKLLCRLFYRNKGLATKQVSQVLTILEAGNPLGNQEFRLDKLLSDVVWPENLGKWSRDIFKNHQPSRLLGDDVGTRFFSQKLGREVACESDIEYKFFSRLESLAEIIYYLEQPFVVEYEFENKIYAYYPDIFFLLADGRGVVVEIKPKYQMALAINLAKWKALRDYCTEKKMGLLVTDGHFSIQDVQNLPVRQEVIEVVWKALQKEALNWQAYQILRDKYAIKWSEFSAMVLKYKLDWRLKPFTLAKTSTY